MERLSLPVLNVVTVAIAGSDACPLKALTWVGSEIPPSVGASCICNNGDGNNNNEEN